MVMCRIRYHDNDEEDLPIGDVLPLLKQTEDLSTDADTTAYAAKCSSTGTCSATSAAKNLMSYGPVCNQITIPAWHLCSTCPWPRGLEDLDDCSKTNDVCVLFQVHGIERQRMRRPESLPKNLVRWEGKG